MDQDKPNLQPTTSTEEMPKNFDVQVNPPPDKGDPPDGEWLTSHKARNGIK